MDAGKDAKGRFVIGHPGHRTVQKGGRPKTPRRLRQDIDTVIVAMESAGLSCLCADAGAPHPCASIREHYVRRALRNDKVLTALMSKDLPDPAPARLLPPSGPHPLIVFKVEQSTHVQVVPEAHGHDA